MKVKGNGEAAVEAVLRWPSNHELQAWLAQEQIAARQEGAHGSRITTQEPIDIGQAAGERRRWLADLQVVEKLHTRFERQPTSPTLPGRAATVASTTDFFAVHRDCKEVKSIYNQHVLPQQLVAFTYLNCLHTIPDALSFADLSASALRACGLTGVNGESLVQLIQSFRMPHLFWDMAATTKLQGNTPLYQAILQAELSGNYDAYRQQSPQMRRWRSVRMPPWIDAWQRGAKVCGSDNELPFSGGSYADTGGFVDLVSSGDDVSGSCQSLSRREHRLLGRLIDGSKRMVAIKDASGRLQARAMFRLMANNDRPALLMGKVYVNSPLSPELAHDLLLRFAMMRATELGLPLYVATPRPGAIAILSSYHAAVQEYWDEGRNGSESRFVDAYRVTDGKC